MSKNKNKTSKLLRSQSYENNKLSQGATFHSSIISREKRQRKFCTKEKLFQFLFLVFASRVSLNFIFIV